VAVPPLVMVWLSMLLPSLVSKVTVTVCTSAVAGKLMVMTRLFLPAAWVTVASV
jgi:hypothetical protein